MDYKYNKLSDHSLKVLLQQHTSLRYEAQLELFEELQQRHVAAEDVQDLALELQRKKVFLKSLGFLKEIGYQVSTQGNTTHIKRRLQSQITEMASLALGVVLVFVGVYGLLNLYYLFTGDEGTGLQALMFNVLFVYMGYRGFQMLGGLPRFINNWGMDFSFSSEQVTLEKRIDLKKEKITGMPVDVELEQTEDALMLKFKGETVLVANPKSFTQRTTLESLLESIKKGEIPQKYQESNYAS